jgi:hypothetical protein
MNSDDEKQQVKPTNVEFKGADVKAVYVGECVESDPCEHDAVIILKDDTTYFFSGCDCGILLSLVTAAGQFAGPQPDTKHLAADLPKKVLKLLKDKAGLLASKYMLKMTKIDPIKVGDKAAIAKAFGGSGEEEEEEIAFCQCSGDDAPVDSKQRAAKAILFHEKEIERLRNAFP